MRHLGLLTLVATAVWFYPVADSRETPHQVTLHLTAFTNEAVVIHIVQSQRALPLRADSAHLTDSLTVRTPADVRVDAAVQRLQLSTEGNLAIRVRFTDGASDKERALAPWGRRLTFVRSAEGDFQPEAEVMPAQPIRSR